MAANSAEGAGFWLPSEFFDDILVDKENIDDNNVTESDSEFRFPNEFPYDLETKMDELVEFSHKRWVMSTSPQSTLSQMGSSPNGYSSPPTTPKDDAIEDLIYLAAGQVARMKLHGPTKHRGPMAPPRSLGESYPAPDLSLIPNIYKQMAKQQKHGCEISQQMYQMRMGQDAWPAHQNTTRIVGGGGAAAKKGCAGTGVFLPRRYGTNECNAYSSDSRKRPGFSAPSMNKNFENMYGFSQSQPDYQAKLGRGFIPEYGLLMARRNAVLLQHQRRLLLEGSPKMNCGVYLPHEWTY